MIQYPPIALYPINVYQAERMSETGRRYSPIRWGSDTREYKGEQGDPDRVLILADGVTIYRTIYDQIGFALDGETALLDTEIVDQHGHILNAAFGTTRPRQDGEPVADLTEIVASLDA